MKENSCDIMRKRLFKCTVVFILLYSGCLHISSGHNLCPKAQQISATIKKDGVTLYWTPTINYCIGTYTIKYTGRKNKQVSYKSGNVMDNQTTIAVPPCDVYKFIFVQYRNKKQVSNKDISLNTSLTVDLFSATLDGNKVILKWQTYGQTDIRNCDNNYYMINYRGRVNQKTIQINGLISNNEAIIEVTLCEVYDITFAQYVYKNYNIKNPIVMHQKTISAGTKVLEFLVIPNGDNATLKWSTASKNCRDTYSIHYYGKINRNVIYLSGPISDNEITVPISPCDVYEFIFYQYRDSDGYILSSLFATLNSSAEEAGPPLEAKLEVHNNNVIYAVWQPPKVNFQCLKSYSIDLFRAKDSSCESVECYYKIYSSKINGEHTVIFLNESICGDYYLSIKSNSEVLNKNMRLLIENKKGVMLNTTLTENSENPTNWTTVQFNQFPSRIYTETTFIWSIPDNLLSCFPEMYIDVCNVAYVCKSYPSYLGNGNARITNLTPNTKYKVHFNIIRNQSVETLSSKNMETIEIPKITDLDLVQSKDSKNIKLVWSIPKDIYYNYQYSVTLRELNGLYNDTVISKTGKMKMEFNILNMKQCFQYNFSLFLNMDGYSSKPVTKSVVIPEEGLNPVNFMAFGIKVDGFSISWTLPESSICIDLLSISLFMKNYTDEILMTTFLNHSYSNNWSFTDLNDDTIYLVKITSMWKGHSGESRQKFVQTLKKGFDSLNNENENSVVNRYYNFEDLRYSVKRVQRGIVDDAINVLQNWFSSTDISDIPVPSEPRNVTVLKVTSDSAMVTWSAPSTYPSNVTEYVIFLSNGSFNYDIPKSCRPTNLFDRIFPVGRNVTSYILPELEPKTKFTINIQAVIGKTIGPKSSNVILKTLAGVPEQVRNFQLNVKSTEAIIDWTTPCHTNGELSHFLLSLNGHRNNHPSVKPSWIVGKKNNKEDYQLVIEYLLPEYNYQLSLTAVVHNMTKENFTVRSFQCPAGIPSQYNMTSSMIVFTILSSSKVTITFDANLFSDKQGDILYYALLLAVDEFPFPPQSLSWSNESWPLENTWAEAALYNNITTYQVTPIRWNPFKDVKEIEYVLGENVCSLGDTKSYCNGALKGQTKYALRVRGFTAGGYSDTISVTFTTEETFSYTSIILLLLLAFTIIITTIFVFIGLYSGKGSKFSAKSRKKVVIVPSIYSYNVGPPNLGSNQFYLHCNMLLENPGKMKEEYDLLINQSAKVASPKTIAILPENKPKNRYANILPYDLNRVILQGNKSDYINASYIKFQGLNNNLNFIACQAPKKDYCYDFWKMIYQCNVEIIIMLCNFEEKNAEKCCRYFPEKDGEILNFEDITVICKSTVTLQNYILRQFFISENDTVKILQHFHWSEWPDFGIPSSTETMLEFCKSIKKHTKNKEFNITVHCSAGVGRTGTFIALMVLLKLLKQNKELNVFATVLHMRSQRANMVQTFEQYEYIYKCLKVLIEQKSRRFDKHKKSENSNQIMLTEQPSTISDRQQKPKEMISEHET
uniref:protein-tyrosine-phosphatase n=1 Tax=Clastoptera arizonana TaxID=38151 RepID=A0A1B6CLA7_9HEMI